ncbi:ORC3-like protein [Saccharomyces kudriavzevii IFO 1802]|uniref:ORC3-like protein n=1 Tax=Saccharomyces kudriavzevii (strain ATCC MYA-4449 / AS 2.2408 / CBS 8840 / NBRC 1802 / NCYC 2889) TaxID=226230 RepID=J6EIE2_SACK1|nr:ORC3-like protein [Saccharomyces kudriavzevii IFO 1802]
MTAPQFAHAQRIHYTVFLSCRRVIRVKNTFHFVTFIRQRIGNKRRKKMGAVPPVTFTFP